MGFFHSVEEKGNHEAAEIWHQRRKYPDSIVVAPSVCYAGL
jgi:hypothetical protein